MSPERMAERLLRLDLTPLRQRLAHRRIRALVSEFKQWRRTDTAAVKADPETRFLNFLRDQIRGEREKIAGLTERLTRFAEQIRGAADVREQALHTLAFARDLGAGSRRLRGDRRAFARWFGPDAAMERCRRRMTDAEGRLTFLLERLGVLAAAAFREKAGGDGAAQLWQQAGVEAAVTPLLGYTGDARVRIAAFRCLSAALRALPREARGETVAESTLQFVYRAAQDRRQHVWIQSEALRLLEHISIESLDKTLSRRLRDPGGGDDIFVRRVAAQLLGANLEQLSGGVDLLADAASDASPFVRQGMVLALGNARPALFQEWMAHYARRDDAPQVRAAALLVLSGAAGDPQRFSVVRDLLAQALSGESDPFVIRTALKAAGDVMERLSSDPESSRQWGAAMLPPVAALGRESDQTAIRRWAAQARERLWCAGDETARTLRAEIARRVAGRRPGRWHALPRRLLRRADSDTLGRVLAVMSQGDYGLSVRRTLFGGRMMRGHRFGFRLWRWWYEFRHPSPDKRQAHRHTIGRHFEGDLRAPSAILSELTPTKVPGEPLYMEAEAGWRPYLPLADEVLSLLADSRLFPRPVRIFTSEGITEMRAPGFLLRRWSSWLRLSRRFARFAQLRNWEPGSGTPPNGYVTALRKLGVRVAFRPYAGTEPPDPEVLRFFQATGGDGES